MSDKPINPILKLVLDLGPVLVFFVAYLLVRDQTFIFNGTEYKAFVLVTAGFVPLILLSTFLLWRLTGKVSKMQIATLVLVVIFGGLTVWFNDDRFFKMKPTFIYALFAGALGIGLLRGQSWLEYMMDGMIPLQPQGWMILTKRLALFFATLAVANEIIWRNMSSDAWVNFKTFALPLALFAFFMAQGKLLERYGLKKDDE
jgi:intracellular septation protein